MLAVALLASGCFGPGVYGTGPVKGCGVAGTPVAAVLGGTQVSWVGTEFTAGDGGAIVWIEGTESDLGDWWGHPIDAWAVFAVDPNGSQPEVVGGSAGLVQYGSTYTAVHVGPHGQAVQDDGRMEPTDHYQLVDPVTLDEGDTLFLLAASTASVDHISLHIYWTGCGQTHETYGGIADGDVVAWDDLEAPLLVASGLVGSGTYEAAWSKDTIEEGVVLARAPPADPVYGGATLTTSRGSSDLARDLAFQAHDGGGLAYEATFVGGPGAAQGPLLVWMPVPISEMTGPIERESPQFDWSDDQ